MLFTYYQHVPLPRALGPQRRAPADASSSRRSRHGAAGFIVAAIVAAALSPSIERDGRDDGERFLREIRQAGRRRSDADARVASSATIIWGVVQIGVALGRAVDAALGARRRPGRALLRIGSRCSARFCSARWCRRSTKGPTFAGMIAGLVVMTGRLGLDRRSRSPGSSSSAPRRRSAVAWLASRAVTAGWTCRVSADDRFRRAPTRSLVDGRAAARLSRRDG